ncbi:MAG: hypothetical protein K2O09_05145, partial [Treponemataceae bacterium]|nr:hypothetical protein [Treponemataceae bacterium]
DALRRAGVLFAYHLFTHGKHGLALAPPETSAPDGSTVEPECAAWVDLFKTWWERNAMPISHRREEFCCL